MAETWYEGNLMRRFQKSNFCFDLTSFGRVISVRTSKSLVNLKNPFVAHQCGLKTWFDMRSGGYRRHRFRKISAGFYCSWTGGAIGRRKWHRQRYQMKMRLYTHKTTQKGHTAMGVGVFWCAGCRNICCMLILFDCHIQVYTLTGNPKSRKRTLQPSRIRYRWKRNLIIYKSRENLSILKYPLRIGYIQVTW